ncbi:MAG: hypothetical protein LBV60_27315 [Streptomyces sp.]|jgi:hypothetical protein|nr:hypothetical protein [Streptomyces sp.]
MADKATKAYPYAAFATGGEVPAGGSTLALGEQVRALAKAAGPNLSMASVSSR